MELILFVNQRNAKHHQKHEYNLIASFKYKAGNKVSVALVYYPMNIFLIETFTEQFMTNMSINVRYTRDEVSIN